MSKIKRVIIWLTVTIAAVVATDIVFGLCFDAYVKHCEIPGDYRSLDHTLKSPAEDLYVLGSSVALNSIDTKMLADSLGVTAFNGASNGQMMPFFLTMLKCITEKHTPQTVILGLTPQDMGTQGAGYRINLLAPYYNSGNKDIREVLDNAGTHNKLFYRSNLYRLNTIWFRILLYNFIEPGIKGSNGFIAKPLPPAFPSKKPEDPIDPTNDERLAQLDEFVDICQRQGIRLIVVFPPHYVDDTDDYAATDEYQSIASLLTSKGVRVYNDVNHPTFANDSTLFYDNRHLNADGAAVYTQMMLDRLRN